VIYTEVAGSFLNYALLSIYASLAASAGEQ